jgi:glutamine synthetase
VKATDKSVLKHFQRLPERPEISMVTYCWIDGTGEHMRAKTKCLEHIPENATDCPDWNFDGSSTGQAMSTDDSDVFLKPARLFPDPFNLGNHRLLLCETLDNKGQATATNHRRSLQEAANSVGDQDPWFGIEQEYTFLDAADGWPLGWPKHGYPLPQGPYYCGVGGGKMFGRDIVEAHLRACIYAGIKINGTNAEVMPSQWEYQVGPLTAMEFGDQVWMSRFLLVRIAEEYGVTASLDPKPMEGDWNGAGAHVNFCCKDFRVPGSGLQAIKASCEKLGKRHTEHITAYDPRGGEDNKRRLTGLHETSSIYEFSHGVAHRGSSIRIPRHVEQKGYGYLEDRRPSSNCDPYVVANRMIRTCLLDE